MSMRLATTLHRRFAVGRRGALTAAALAAAAVVLTPMMSAHADTVFIVNSIGDGPGCTLNSCTLRGAITAADNVTGPATINFAISGAGPFTISPGSMLPMLTNPAGITIDGYSQPGASPNTADAASNAVIRINIMGPGTNQTTIEGIRIGSSGNTIRGLAMYNWRHALLLNGTYHPSTGEVGSNSIVGNFICTNSSGTFRAPGVNGGAAGIILSTGAHDNLIGTPLLADRNVISGCAHRGVTLTFDGTNFNKIQNNIVGLTPDGLAGLGNRAHGLDVNYSANDNLIGGTALHEHNVVSGNDNEGIEVSHGSGNRRNKVIGNYVGTNLTGDRAFPYTSNGQSTTNIAGYGVRLEGEHDCNPCAPNAGYIEVANNVIANNTKGGILIDKGQQWNWIHDNNIGVLLNGTTPAGNGAFGLRFEHGAINNTVGPGNIIANNTRGVQMQATGTQPPSSLHVVTPWNRLTQNTIYNNGGIALGIDLFPYGQPNVGGVGDPAVNHGIQAPVITSATLVAVSGTSCANCMVEVYVADTTTTTGLAGYGEPKTYVGTVTADGSGHWSMSSLGLSGKTITATATDPSGNAAPPGVPSGATAPGDTSEAARNRQVP